MSNTTIVTKATVKSALDDMGISVRLNKISGKMEVSGNKAIGADVINRIKSDPADLLSTLLRDHFNGSGLTNSRRAIKAHLAVIADENRYNPVQKFLDETARDGQDHISALLDQAMGLKAQPDKDTVKRWLLQTMAMAFNGEDNGNSNPDDGRDAEGKRLHSADGLLVLVGPQGCGKTLFLSKLAVKSSLFHAGDVINVHDRNNVIENTSYWINELSDVDHLSSIQRAFITKAQDTYRPRYAKFAIDKPRRTSFCAGVTKVPEELGRRLWVVDASNFDLKRIQGIDKAWIKQLWKQVYEELYLPNPEGFYSIPTGTVSTEGAEDNAN